MSVEAFNFIVLLAAVLFNSSTPVEAAAGDETASAVVTVDPRASVGPVNPLIYGHFLEHFHRIVYGGIYDPESPLSDENGFRKDVIEALRRIRVPILRWPGGCFASAYHWQDGIGENRAGVFDKAWRVEEPNTFGTDEFIAFCGAVGAEPYICGNAGTGTEEEMSDWVEYCNLRMGKWGRLREANGHREPHAVRYWSVGNENWGGHEIGAKTAEEFARFVTEAAKMMKRVDGSIQLLAPSVPNLDWNRALLREAGPHLDFIAVHIYSDGLWQRNNPAPYTTCVKRSVDPESLISRTRNLLSELGRGDVKIALDEWNLRGWHHPSFTAAIPDIAARDLNDLNSTYTCADAVYAGCFLNACLRHADKVQMANFAPIVNCRGAIFTHENGIVLRPTYHIFDLYTNHALPESLEVGVAADPFLAAGADIPVIDAAMTRGDDGRYALAATNRHDRLPVRLQLKMMQASMSKTAELWTVTGPQPDSFNDVDHPADVTLKSEMIRWNPNEPAVSLPPHSVNMICFKAVVDSSDTKDLLINGGFELEGSPTLPYSWRPVEWGGAYRAALETDLARGGKRCVLLESSEGADCAWTQNVSVKPYSTYRLSGWIRTANVTAGTGKGAFLNVQEVQGPTTPPLTGTNDWVRVEMRFKSGEQKRVQVNCLLGGWGRSRGKSWYDDVKLELVGN